MSQSISADGTARLTLGLAIVCLMLAGHPAQSRAQEWAYVVQPGDSLWSIARDLLRNWRDWNALGVRNALANNDIVQPGSTLYVPLDWLARSPTSARVVEATGACRLRAASGADSPVKSGLRLTAGDRIETGPDSFILIEFDDGSRLGLAENSAVVLVALNRIGRRPHAEVELRLESGRGEVEANPGAAPNTRFEIRGPAATTSVRGTRFRIGALHDATRAEVTSGSVALANAVGGVELPAGFGTVAAADRGPLPPRSLLPAPAHAGVPSRIEYLPAQFDFEPVVGARHYRAQIMGGTELTQLLVDEIFESPPWQLPENLANGRYRLRVRAVDELGLEGFDTSHAIQVAAHPRPPEPLAPADAALIYGPVDFAWRHPDATAAVRLQVARSPRFDDPISLDASGAGVTLDSLAPGEWNWRLATLDTTGNPGPMVQGGSFAVRRVPAPPVAIRTRNDGRLAVSWRGHGDDAGWRVQIARDVRFSDVFFDSLVHEPRLDHARLILGPYYLRISARDDDGFEGPFSDPVTIAR